MNIKEISLFISSIDPKYTIMKKDNLDQYRGIINFLVKDISQDLRDYENKKYNLYVKFKIKQQIEKWSIPQIRHIQDKIDEYIRNGNVD